MLRRSQTTPHLRLKGNLTASLGGRNTTTGALARARYFEGVMLTGKRGKTNIGVIQDRGHLESWIIAMSERPAYLSTLDYANRWGIEPMFSDFKSRRFGIEQTHIQYPDRLACPILVMALALYSAVSTGMWDQANNPPPTKKTFPPSAQKTRKGKALMAHPRHPTRHPPLDQGTSATPTLGNMQS